MRSHLLRALGIMVLTMVFIANGFSQDVKPKNARSWSVAGLVQLQHLYDSQIKADDPETNNGFRIRTGRLQVRAKLTDFISTNFQAEIRDNKPKLLDAEGSMRLFDAFYLRAGQFKVPVWREELRSSSKLLLVERSAAADFLKGEYLSARNIGVEFGGKLGPGIEFEVNYSNGSGEGGREDAGQNKTDNINNGKLYTARVNVPLDKSVQVGVSGALNQRGFRTMEFNDRGNAYVVAPDFGIYLPTLDVEGGVAVGAISKNFLFTSQDQKFTLMDITGRYRGMLAQAVESLAGMDGFEIAAGVSYVNPDNDMKDDELVVYRFGPALDFGKHTRLQVNGEIEDFTAPNVDSRFLIRSQLTLVF